MLCSSVEAAYAAGYAKAVTGPPLSQEAADQVAAILAHRTQPEPATTP